MLVPLKEKAVLEEEQASLRFSKDGFSGLEDTAAEVPGASQAQFLHESPPKRQLQPPPPPPSNLKAERIFLVPG